MICEKCKIDKDDVEMLKITSYQATVGYLCSQCKIKLNQILLPIAQRHTEEMYSAATKFVNPDEYFLAE